MKHANMQYWTEFAKTIKIIRREDWKYLPPTPLEDLERFEREWDIPLPESYKAFLRVFGPGELAEVFQIMSPYCPEKHMDLVGINSNNRQYMLQNPEYIDDSTPESTAQLKRALRITQSFYTHEIYVFDPLDISDISGNEYAVYYAPGFPSEPLVRVADCFTEFIEEYCLGDRYEQIRECPFPTTPDPDDYPEDWELPTVDRRTYEPVFVSGKSES